MFRDALINIVIEDALERRFRDLEYLDMANTAVLYFATRITPTSIELELLLKTDSAIRPCCRFGRGARRAIPWFGGRDRLVWQGPLGDVTRTADARQAP